MKEREGEREPKPIIKTGFMVKTFPFSVEQQQQLNREVEGAVVLLLSGGLRWLPKNRLYINM